MSDGPLTKRKMLSAINGVYDLLGLAAPVIIAGKILYSEVCLRKLRWDQVVTDEIQRSRNNWLKGMEKCPSISVPRRVVSKDVRRIDLHSFADASKLARFSNSLRTCISSCCSSSPEPACCEVKNSSKTPVNPTVGAYCSTHLEQIDESCEGSNGRSAS